MFDFHGELCLYFMVSCVHVFSRDSAPGQKECDSAIGNLNRTIRELDQASLEAIRQNLMPRDTNTLKGFQEQMINSAREILDRVEDIRQAARQEPENLGHLVSSSGGVCVTSALAFCLSVSFPLSPSPLLLVSFSWPFPEACLVRARLVYFGRWSEPVPQNLG